MNAVKKSDLKSELEDILLSEDSDSDIIMSKDSEGSRIHHEIPAIEKATSTQLIQPPKVVPTAKQKNTSQSTLHAEHLSMAQERISTLQAEIDNLRSENERLTVASESYRATADSLNDKIGVFEKRRRGEIEKLSYEKNHIQDQFVSKEKEIEELKHKVEELENRLQFDLKKIRVKERELQNRLELMKVDGSAVVRSKDEMILDLKRQMDQLNQEVEGFKHRAQVQVTRNDLNEDRMKRSVKALRLALSLLEGEEETISHLKKVD